MKKVILILATIPTFLAAQNITNTLGTSGSFIVEDVNNNSLIRASRTGSTRMYFGDYQSNYNLPAGDIDFIHDQGSEKVNIVVGRGTSFSAIPKLQFYYTPGSLASPLEIEGGDILGIINFGGYRSSGGWTIGSSISAEVDLPSGTSLPGGSIPSRLDFRTDPPTASGANVMTFDSGGNLTVPGAITSQEIKIEQLNVDNSDSYNLTLNDQTVIFNIIGAGTGNVDVNLPAANTLKGKTFTVKRGSTVSTRTLTLNASANIDGSTSYVLGSGYSYVTVQSDGSKWWVVGEGAGN